MDNIKVLSKLLDIQTVIAGWILRLIIIIILILAGIHFNENPIGITIVIIIGLILMLLISRDYTLLLSSLGLIVRKTILGIWNKDEIIEYSKIESIIYTGDYTLSKEIFFDLMLGDLAPNPNFVKIKFKDGSLKKFRYYIFKNRIIDFVTLGNNLIKKK